MTDPLSQVKQNLLFYNLWTDVTEINLSDDILLEGIPKEPLLNDEDQDTVKEEDQPFIEEKASTVPKNERREIVLPYRVSDKLSPMKLSSIFKDIESIKGERPKRILIGIINDDSTIVYYFIHDGVYKPKKN